MLHDKGIRKGRKQRYFLDIYTYQNTHTNTHTNKEEIFLTITILISETGYVVIAGICNYFLPPQLRVMVLQLVELSKPSFLRGSKPLVVLSGSGYCSSLLTLISEHGHAKRFPKGSTMFQTYSLTPCGVANFSLVVRTNYPTKHNNSLLAYRFRGMRNPK